MELYLALVRVTKIVVNKNKIDIKRNTKKWKMIGWDYKRSGSDLEQLPGTFLVQTEQRRKQNKKIMDNNSIVCFF